MSGGRQGEESSQLVPPPAQVDHPAWSLPCAHKRNVGRSPSTQEKSNHVLPFPGVDLPLQTHPRGLFPFSRAEQRPVLTLGMAETAIHGGKQSVAQAEPLPSRWAGMGPFRFMCSAPYFL